MGRRKLHVEVLLLALFALLAELPFRADVELLENAQNLHVGHLDGEGLLEVDARLGCRRHWCAQAPQDGSRFSPLQGGRDALSHSEWRAFAAPFPCRLLLAGDIPKGVPQLVAPHRLREPR